MKSEQEMEEYLISRGWEQNKETKKWRNLDLKQNDLMLEAAHLVEYCRENSEQIMEEYLLLRGWTKHKRPFRGEDVSMWNHSRLGTMGLQTEPAYRLEAQHEEMVERNKNLAKGKIDVFCNKCGANLKMTEKDYYGKEFFTGYYGLVDAEVHGGYNSTHLKDCSHYTFSLCEKCLKELFDTFKTPVKEENYLI